MREKVMIHKAIVFSLIVMLFISVMWGCSKKDIATERNIKSGEISTSQGTIKEKATQEEIIQEEAIQEDITQEGATQEESTREEATQEDITQEETTKEITTKDITTNETITKETTTKETITKETTTKETTTKETTTKEITTKPTTQQEKTTEQSTTSVEWLRSEQETVVGEVEQLKYGTTRVVTTIRYYDLYSNGYKWYHNERYLYEYDYTGFSATDDEMKEEAMQVADEYREYQEEVLQLVNELRAEAGVEPVILDETMCDAATMRTVEMVYSNKFSHTRPDGRKCLTVLEYFGVERSCCAENIAAGFPSPVEVVECWKKSNGHYSSMINPDFKRMGIGYMKNEPGAYYSGYWVQLFSN